MELPPLARGIRVVFSKGHALTGITPARAGNTFWRCRRIFARWNYPRSRGEYASGSRAPLTVMELPPLARGIQVTLSLMVTIPGITPARAGNTPPNHALTKAFWNYPRSRGEYDLPPIAEALGVELPPLARGIHCLTGNFRLTVGDIV